MPVTEFVMEQFQVQMRILRPLLPTYVHLIASALLPIYAGAHASLTRPSSAAERSKSAKKVPSKDALEDDSEEESVSKIEGLSASDALWFPVLAGCTLGGLYLLIKWLEDPSIISKILNWYFAVFGVLGIARLFNDSLSILASFIFPDRYFHDGQTWEFDNLNRCATSKADPTQSRTSPLPGFLSRIPLPAFLNRFYWALRTSYPTFCIRLFCHPFQKIHTHITPSTVLSLLTAFILVLYYNLVSRPWYLTNILGFAFAYNALQLISPTTSSTGTLILASLFIYDIYFVFFTPLMVTVATSLDIPAKLLFPRPPGPDGDPAKQHLSMLGLGDVVLPGMMIGFALRLDLYLHYLKQQKSVPVVNAGGDSRDDEIITIVANKLTEIDNAANKDNPKSPIQTEISASPSTYAPDPSTSTKIIIKPPFLAATGHWGDSFWLSVSYESQDDASIAGTKFPKPYFYASLQGYILGMLLTLGAMQVTGVAQPALLYLVPCVLLYFWGMAVLRGEVRQVWRFDESEEQKGEEKEKEKEQSDDKGEGEKDGKIKGERREEEGSRSPSRESSGATTVDFLSLGLKVGMTSNRSTKGCLRKEQPKQLRTGSENGSSIQPEGWKK